MDNNNQSSKQEEDLTKILEETSASSKRIFSKFLHQHPKPSFNYNMGQLANLGNLYRDFYTKLFSNPTKLAEAQFSYWRDFLSLWTQSILQWSTKKEEPKEIDKRFQDTAWEEHPFFHFIKHFYLITAKHIQNVVNDVEGVDPKVQKKINFYTKQYVDAMSPSNFIMTNPEVLRTTLKTGGKNLLKGYRNMLQDFERSDGQLMNIQMTDLKAFKVGKNLAITPGKVVFQNELMQLIQYEPQTDQVYRRPLLMIPAWINKYYILDLNPEKSLAKWLVDQGYTIYMISWVNPDKRHAKMDFQNYMLQGPLAALDAIEKATGEKEVNALGFCLGGTLLACLLAYMAEKGDGRITSATYLGTLLDFSDPGDIVALIDDNQIRLLEHEMHQKGYLDGGSMSMTFNMLRANDLIWSYFIKNYLQGEEPFPFDLLYWNADATNMPAKMHSFYLRGMYLHNLLIKPNAIKLGEIPIDLSKVKVPAYFLSTHFDHIAPWKSTFLGLRLFSGETVFVLGGSGHVAGVINPPQQKKYCYYTNPEKEIDAEEWLKKAEEHAGSWWPHWEKWLQNHSNGKVAARIPGKGPLPIIEPAPGSYVKVSLADLREKD